MIKKRVSLLIKISILCLGFIFSTSRQPCFAAFSLSVEPFEGGYDLRFGKVNTQDPKVIKELTIRITTDIGKQYRVFQRLDKSLMTPDGTEIDRNKFRMYTLINSNSKGTLERIEEFPVMSSDTVIYTSNTAGDSDSFKLVYTLEPSINQVAGSYHGRLIFYLLPIDSSQSQVIKTINMYVDLTNEGAVEISTDTGFKTIRISSDDLEKINLQFPTVYISVKGTLGARYRIYQQLGGSLVKASSGDKFDLKKVIYEATDINSGTLTKQGDLSDLQAKSLIYASDNLGTGNQIAIRFKPTADFAQQKASLYTGTINYYLELDRTTSVLEPGFIDSVNLNFDIKPIFRLIVTSVTDSGTTTQQGSAILKFGSVDYKSGTKENKVRVRVESNLGEPYLVTQKLKGPLQNKDGYKIPDELFTFELAKQTDTGATLKIVQETVVESGQDTALFISNSDGDSDEFDITYRLKVTPDTRGGDYLTAMSYSLSEL